VTQALLVANNAQLRSALRKVMAQAKINSDMGTAPWYQEALRALGQRLE